VRVVHICFALHDKDGRYWQNTAAAIISAVVNTRSKLKFWILHDSSLLGENINKLKIISENLKVEIEFIKIEINLNKKLNLEKFSEASVFRLFLNRVFKNYEKIIYLDSDLIINEIDIKLLIEESDTNFPVAAVKDNFIIRSVKHIEHNKKINISNEKYFNSGVMVLKPKLITDDLYQEFFDFMNLIKVSLHPDQEFLNYKFQNMYHELNEKWNYQVTVYDNRHFQNLNCYTGKIIHYTGKIKPLDGVLSPGFLIFHQYISFMKGLGVFDNDLIYNKYLAPNSEKNDSIIVKRIY
jgi:lipopolysaccharide biosynthesis glycosyltransferase